MINVFKCANCGHTMKVPEEQLGRKLRCQMCNSSFHASKDLAVARYEKDASGHKKHEKVLSRLTKKADAAIMLDGAIGGAIGGIIVGLLVGSIAGAAQEIAKADNYNGVAIGGVLSGLFVGFVLGFGLGVLIGVVLGLFSKIINNLLELKANQASVVSGTLTGAAVAAVLGSPRWSLIGAVLGGIGAALWSLLHGWADSYMPPAPSKIEKRKAWDLDDSDDDDRPTKRHTIDPGAGDYPKGVGGAGWRRSQAH